MSSTRILFVLTVTLGIDLAYGGLFHGGTPGGVPLETDCALRQSAYEYGKKLQPWFGEFQSLFNALQLGNCNSKRGTYSYTNICNCFYFYLYFYIYIYITSLCQFMFILTASKIAMFVITSRCTFICIHIFNVEV